MTIRRDAASIVRSRLRATQGLAAVITRGQDSCACVVALGNSNLVATAKNEFRIQSDAQEIFVQTADYKPTGVVLVPEMNDRITVTMPDGTTANFDVRIPNKGEQCYQTSMYGTELRIHCRHVTPLPQSI